jgi:hypothetical protein
MKEKWFVKDIKFPTPEQLEAIIGVKVKQVTMGNIDTGEVINAYDGEGKTIQIPLMKPGIEIEVDGVLTDSQLAKLDGIFSDMVREGSTPRNLVKELDDLKAKVTELEERVR